MDLSLIPSSSPENYSRLFFKINSSYDLTLFIQGHQFQPHPFLQSVYQQTILMMLQHLSSSLRPLSEYSICDINESLISIDDGWYSFEILVE